MIPEASAESSQSVALVEGLSALLQPINSVNAKPLAYHKTFRSPQLGSSVATTTTALTKDNLNAPF